MFLCSKKSVQTDTNEGQCKGQRIIITNYCSQWLFTYQLFNERFPSHWVMTWDALGTKNHLKLNNYSMLLDSLHVLCTDLAFKHQTYQSPNHVKLWLKYFFFDPRAGHGRRLSWSWRNIGRAWEEGKRTTSHHPIYYNNTMLWKLDLCLRCQCLYYLIPFVFWQEDKAICVLLWLIWWSHVISCVNLFFFNFIFKEAQHLCWLTSIKL